MENPRLQRLKEKMSPYMFKTVWRKGSDHSIPDALSRAPVSAPSSDDLLDEKEFASEIRAILVQRITVITDRADGTVPPAHRPDPLLEQLQKSASLDPAYQALIDAVEKGFPKKPEEAAASVREYWKLREDLWTEGGLVIFKARIVVPAADRVGVLSGLHAAHQGVERTKRRARQTVYWPGLTSDILSTVRSCFKCQEALPSIQQETMKSDPPPSRIFEEASADFFSFATNHYLVYADRLSGWPTIHAWYGKDVGSKEVIQSLTRGFVDLGVPVRLRTDGGPQFASAEFADFAKKWGVHLQLSTPHYPQSNGHAEAAVKSMKALLSKSSTSGRIDSEDFLRGLLEWRNTPRANGLSPAEMVFGHNIRSIIPAHHKAYARKWQDVMDRCEMAAGEEKRKAKQRYDGRSKELKPMENGSHVRVQNPMTKRWDKRGVIIHVGQHRDYRVKLLSGRVYWRNRRFIRPDYSDDTAEPVAEQQAKKKTVTFPEQPSSPRRGSRVRRSRHILDV